MKDEKTTVAHGDRDILIQIFQSVNLNLHPILIGRCGKSWYIRDINQAAQRQRRNNLANEKIRVTVVLEYGVNGEYTTDQYDDLTDQVTTLAEESELDLIDLSDGTRLNLESVSIESVEEI